MRDDRDDSPDSWDASIGIEWEPPADWIAIETIDAHTGGEPLRIVTDGFPPIEGETILEKRRFVREEFDHLRRALMWEPRGHADMYGALLVEPDHPDADIGVLFTHNEGYSTMCGHGIIGLGTVLPEADVPTDGADSLRIQTPAGLVTARPQWRDGGRGGRETGRRRERVDRVAFENVPSFVLARDEVVDVPGLGEVRYDVAFGGAFYAFCDADSVGVSLDADDYRRLVDYGRRIKRAVADALEITHPVEADLSFLYGTIFTGPPEDDSADSRNVCVFADGEVDRCPTGTGVSARVALRRDAGTLSPGDSFVVESIVGSTFVGRIADEVSYEGYDAVIPEITGSAHVTGRNELLVDPEDPFGNGFFLR